MRDAAPIPIWEPGTVKRALAGIAIVLTLGLGAQWVYQDHDRLSASRPNWQPALTKVCAFLRCSVQPLQKIESMAIDSAAFTKLGPDRYRLSFVLKNTDPLMLAVPSVELTLTDVQDQVVVRRVLSPRELAAASERLPAASEWPVAVNLRVTSDVSSLAVVGYRLLAFYP